MIIELSEKLASGKYSLHLPKDVLSNLQSYYETNKLLKILQCYKSTKKIHLVTHIPTCNFKKYLKYILNISKELPENYILLLENEKIDKNNYTYFMQINELCALLHKQNVENVGICLDIGHLLFGAHLEGIEQDYCLHLLNQMPYILFLIKQIHIHDFYNIDHLQLGNGIMNLKSALMFIVKNNLAVPIIIETTVSQPEFDGIKQVSLIRQELND